MLEIGSKPIFKVYIILNKIFWNGLNSFLFHFLPFLLFFNWEVHSPSCYSVGKGTMDGCVVPQLVIFNFLQPLHVCCFHPAPTQKTKLHKLRIWLPSPKKTKNTEKHQETMRSHIQSDRKANRIVMTELVRNINKYNNKCTTPEHLPSPSECLAYTWLGMMPTNPAH